MKYHPPYGLDPNSNAPYINGDPSIGRAGSIIPAEAVEYPQRELTNFFNISNFLPSDSDMNQLSRSVQAGIVNFATDVGAQNAMVCTLSPPLIGTAYTAGLMIRLKLGHTNLNDVSHTTFTLDAGLGARNVVMPDGSLPPDQTLKGGGVYLIIFDGTRWQVAGAPTSGGGGGTGTTYQVNIPYVNDTGPSSNNITAIYTPPVGAITEGLFIAVKLAHNLITATCNITVNTFPPKHIARADGSSPVAGDAGTNQILLLCFDGTNFQIVGVLGIPISRPMLQVAAPYPYGQSVANGTITQISGLNVIMTNTLATSTWNGTVLTVGNGESGLWHVKSLSAYGNGLQAATYTVYERIRASAPVLTAGWGYNTSPAWPSDSSCSGSGVVELLAGDILQLWSAQYNQSNSTYPYYQPGYVAGVQATPNVELTFLNRP